ncbi:MAG: 2-oxoacid:acceptor oxidoreductase family protein [Candidatus Helarchaeota archaeon]
MNENKIYEIRWHGRGGQGTVTAANMVSAAAFADGYKGVQSIPLIGAERRGSAIQVFSRLSKETIRIHSQIQYPDIVVCIDPSLFASYADMVMSGIKEDGILIVNSSKKPEEINTDKKIKICTVDASGISVNLNLEFGGAFVVNSPMLGAFVKGTGLIQLETLLSLLEKKWKGEWGARNIEAVKTAYEKCTCVKK